MRESETLIRAVEKHPCLWDINHEDYPNKVLKGLAWKQVCKEVIHNWDTYGRTEKLHIRADLKKKWTNIRDYYRKHLLGMAAAKNKKYVYAHRLHFLNPIFGGQSADVRKYHSEDSNSEHSEKEHVTYLDIGSDTIKFRATSPPQSSNPLCTESDTPFKTIKDISTQNSNMFYNTYGDRTAFDVDDDTNFLLSFRGDMKRMSVSQKLDFKFGMLQLIKKINEEQ